MHRLDDSTISHETIISSLVSFETQVVYSCLQIIGHRIYTYISTKCWCFSGSLIGRCHVLTAGHCVLHPTEFKISKELKFTPAQNGGKSAAPFGTFDFIDVKVARRWAIFSDPAHDIALIHIKGSGDLVDKRLG